MQVVTLKALRHRDNKCIGIYSDRNTTLNYYLQKKDGARWSRSNKCWYVPCTEKNYEVPAYALLGKHKIKTPVASLSSSNAFKHTSILHKENKEALYSVCKSECLNCIAIDDRFIL